jgi:hypothetical protein
MHEYMFIVIRRASLSSEKELDEFISRSTLGYIIEKRLYILTLLPVTIPEKRNPSKHGCNVGTSSTVESAVAQWHIVPAAVSTVTKISAKNNFR